MTKFDWKAMLRAIAPTLATYAGGPLAGIVVKEIGDKLLGKKDATEADIEQALAAMSPDHVVKLREIDSTFETRMAEIGLDVKKLHVEYEKIAASDRDSARRREMEVKDWMPKVLGISVVGASLCVGIGVVFHDVPTLKDPTVALQVGTVIGYLFGEAKAVMTYYFGSSAGSDKKTDVIARGMKDDQRK